jgi:hypothetical protein
MAKGFKCVKPKGGSARGDGRTGNRTPKARAASIRRRKG